MTDSIGTTATAVRTRTGRVGILDVTREYGLPAVYERIARLRASGQCHAALAIEEELRAAGVAAPDAA
ncbi:hypothetical protein [Nocardia blacklockiae]|uniref:hypothetical protein n=1 Tax=Nocardia blacklockiae TaxID=480036 RepID=UPI0018945D0B|nr:hypothetical protein [Nocardia blacklockiae]MBF6171845.1 hypothetical protein [Nocardia blacklockiae]